MGLGKLPACLPLHREHNPAVIAFEAVSSRHGPVRTFEFWREVYCELPEVCQLLAQLQLRAVE